jgi:cytoskeletal protein CcmA (bactofilin family)
MFAKTSKPQNRIDTLIGKGTTIVGDITFSGGLRVDGEIKGNVRGAGDGATTIVLSEHAVVAGAIDVAHVVINGTVNGPVVSTEFLELQDKARVVGDVQYQNIEIHLGAVVEGNLVHTGAAGSKAAGLKLASAN